METGSAASLHEEEEERLAHVLRLTAAGRGACEEAAAPASGTTAALRRPAAAVREAQTER
jgi:hypothetical protein